MRRGFVRTTRQGVQQLRHCTLPHAAPRPVELLRPEVLWRSHRLARKLRRSEVTLVTPRRARTLYRLARLVDDRGVPGALVDCGAGRGGSSILLSEGAPSREVWAFDSFEGLPSPTVEDLAGPVLPVGEFCATRQQVEQAFRAHGKPSQLILVEGRFRETLRAAAERVGPIAILHVDADYYEPVRLALQTFYPSVSPGGYVIVDDYVSFPGARQATDELRAQERVRAPLVWGHYWQR